MSDIYVLVHNCDLLHNVIGAFNNMDAMTTQAKNDEEPYAEDFCARVTVDADPIWLTNIKMSKWNEYGRGEIDAEGLSLDSEYFIATATPSSEIYYIGVYSDEMKARAAIAQMENQIREKHPDGHIFSNIMHSPPNPGVDPLTIAIRAFAS